MIHTLDSRQRNPGQKHTGAGKERHPRTFAWFDYAHHRCAQDNKKRGSHIQTPRPTDLKRRKSTKNTKLYADCEDFMRFLCFFVQKKRFFTLYKVPSGVLLPFCILLFNIGEQKERIQTGLKCARQVEHKVRLEVVIV